MNSKLVAVSKLCSEIVATKQVHLEKNKPLSLFRDLEETILDTFGECLDDIDIYWRYSKDEFFLINDYTSYMAALTLSAEKNIYLLLKDYQEPWKDNIDYLRTLEYVEDRKEEEKHRDIYDVKIKRAGDVDSDEEDERMLEESQDVIVEHPRSNAEVLLFALRKFPEPKVFTADLIPHRKLVKDLITGCRKEKEELMYPADEVIERILPKGKDKDKKGKGKKK